MQVEGLLVERPILPLGGIDLRHVHVDELEVNPNARNREIALCVLAGQKFRTIN